MFCIYLFLLIIYCRMIMEYKSCHGMESTSVLQAIDQVGLWHTERKISCITCKSSQCPHTSFLAENAKALEYWLAREYLKEDNTSPWVKVFSWKGIPFDLDDVDLKHQYPWPLLENISSSLLDKLRVCFCRYL